MSTADLQNLRPLSVGEILDRAFSICFKNIISFTAIVAVVVVPQLVLYYRGMRDPLSMIADQMGSLQGTTGGAVPPDPTRMLQAYADGWPYFLGLIAVAVILVPLSNAAVVSGISRAYLGLPVRFAQCYADALPRFPALLGLMLLWFVAVSVAMLAFGVFFFVLALPLGMIGSSLGVAGIVLASLIGIAAGIAALLVAMLLYLAAAFSFVATVLEGLGAGAAFSSGFARVFGEGQLSRSLGIGAALFGIALALYIVGAIVGGITAALTHSFAFEFAASGLVGAFTYPFAFSVVGVSYYDVRIRREGFDLQMLAARLTSPSAAASS